MLGAWSFGAATRLRCSLVCWLCLFRSSLLLPSFLLNPSRGANSLRFSNQCPRPDYQLFHMIGAYCSYNAHIVFLCLQEVAFANFLLLYLNSWQSFFFFWFCFKITVVGVQREPQVNSGTPFSAQQKTLRARDVVEWSRSKRTAEWSDVAGRKKKCKTRSGRKSQEVNSRTSPGGTVDKNLPAHAGDTGSIPGPGGLHVPQGS